MNRTSGPATGFLVAAAVMSRYHELAKILKSYDLVLDSPEPVVRVHMLGDSSVEFIVRPWGKVDDYWQVYWDITRTVKLRFDEEGISIPFPPRDVHIYNHNSITHEEVG